MIPKNSHETLNYTPKHETPPLEAGAIWEEISTYTLHNVGRNCSKFPLKKSRCEGRLVCTCTWAQRSQQPKNTERWSHDTYCYMTPSNYLDMLLVYNEKLNPKKIKKNAFKEPKIRYLILCRAALHTIYWALKLLLHPTTKSRSFVRSQTAFICSHCISRKVCVGNTVPCRHERESELESSSENKKVNMLRPIMMLLPQINECQRPFTLFVT